MTRGRATGLEKAIDGLAATTFACCAAWSFLLWGMIPIDAVGSAAVAGILALVALQRMGAEHGGFDFTITDADFDEPVDDTLLLDDRLAEPAEDSQIVRLFAVGGGGAVSHAPGELASRIDQFLERGRAPLRAVPAQPDAAQELFQALADIRRTLR